MAISGDYSSPQQVNGFSCRNCTDVEYAKKNIDPVHPKSGPNNVDAASDPSQPAPVRLKLEDAKAMAAGAAATVTGYSPGGATTASPATGVMLDLRA